MGGALLQRTGAQCSPQTCRPECQPHDQWGSACVVAACDRALLLPAPSVPLPVTCPTWLCLGGARAVRVCPREEGPSSLGSTLRLSGRRRHCAFQALASDAPEKRRLLFLSGMRWKDSISSLPAEGLRRALPHPASSAPCPRPRVAGLKEVSAGALGVERGRQSSGLRFGVPGGLGILPAVPRSAGPWQELCGG